MGAFNQMFPLVYLRAAVKTVIERLTHSTYLATLRMLLDRDRPLYSLLVALEVSLDLGMMNMNPILAGHTFIRLQWLLIIKPFDKSTIDTLLLLLLM